MADKPLKQSQQETADLRSSVKGMLQDRIFKGKKIPAGSRKKFPGLKELGSGGYAEIDTIEAGGNPLHYHTHIAKKGKAHATKKRKK